MKEATNLNLGCGNKFIKGWINYDFDPPSEIPEGCEFKQGDVRYLKDFSDNSVDYILAAHIIEHISPNDTDAMLKEWFRVLKPNGGIAIECPDMIKCCVNFLTCLTLDDPTTVVALGLRGIFGKSDVEGDGMEHKWGFWPQDLHDRLEQAGFVDTFEELPLVKPATASIRDMRITARKPTK